MYTVAYIDRTNFALAIPSLQKEYAIGAGQAGWAAGVFFLGYLLLQIPGGHLAQVWSAKKFITVSLLFWGIFATLCGVARSFEQLLLYRFLLGVGEGGVWPATVVLLSNWFAPHERARANGYWVLCQPVAIVISSPFAGWLIDHYNWRVMFIVQGLLPVFIAAIWWWAVEDRPSEAAWSQDDIPHNSAVPPNPNADRDRWEFLRSRNVWVWMWMDLAFACGAYGLLMWLPTAVRSTGVTNNLAIGAITAVPYLFAMVGAVYNSRRSDLHQERRWHVAAPCLAAGICLTAGGVLGDNFLLIRLLLVCATAAGVYASIGPMWAFMSETVPQRTAGMSLGLINAFANLGGLAGPYLAGAVRDITHSFHTSFILLGLLLALAGLFTLMVTPSRMSSSAKA